MGGSGAVAVAVGETAAGAAVAAAVLGAAAATAALAAISLSDFRVVERRISSSSSAFLLVVFSFFLPIVGYMGVPWRLFFR
jgi:hypothetical protein